MTCPELSEEAIHRGLSTCVMGKRVIHLPVTTSTMDVVHQEAHAGAPEGTLAIADEQTAGRGRFQRSWVSTPGTSLHMTLLLRPREHELRRMNMAVSLAVVQAIRAVTGLRATIKWPNDIRLRGRKVSGILIESQPDHNAVPYTAVGVGINVNFDPSPFPEIVEIATSLMAETGRRISRLEVLQSFLRHLDALYATLRHGQPLHDEWSSSLETLGQHVKVRWGDRVEEGVAFGVDADGDLLLDRPDGARISLPAGEVTFQR